MKDAYSFDVSEQDSKISYNKMFVAYMNTFKRLGIKAIPVVADSGPIGGNISHEFSIIAETGETEVYFDKRIHEVKYNEINFSNEEELERLVNKYTSFYSSTEDKHDEKIFSSQVMEENQKKGKAIEVGHIFSFGTKYSEPMRALITDENGKNIPVYMGSYGIGVSRLVAAIIESSHDETGIIWPSEVAPFEVGIINLGLNDKSCLEACENIKEEIEKNGYHVIVDDRDESTGKKYTDMDLIGIPYQIIIGPRDLKNGKIEFKKRSEDKKELLEVKGITEKLISKIV